MQPKPSGTAVFIMRCWQEAHTTPQAASLWRYRLEDPRTGQHWSFASLAALHTFLETYLQTNQVASQ
ncbi:MAG: hypothetical protein IAF02_22760 [Anaerolineae bacterium]|nr:hypothetical protein [Anaerolineae bacterium]